MTFHELASRDNGLIYFLWPNKICQPDASIDGTLHIAISSFQLLLVPIPPCQSPAILVVILPGIYTIQACQGVSVCLGISMGSVRSPHLYRGFDGAVVSPIIARADGGYVHTFRHRRHHSHHMCLSFLAHSMTLSVFFLLDFPTISKGCASNTQHCRYRCHLMLIRKQA